MRFLAPRVLPCATLARSVKSIHLLAGCDCLRGCQCHTSNGCALPIRALPAALHSMPSGADSLLPNEPAG